MPNKDNPTTSNDGYLRLPVSLSGPNKKLALAVKHAMEKRLGKTVTWAFLIRTALRTQAGVEGVKWK